MGASLSRCVEPGGSYAVFSAVKRGDLATINSRLSLDPDLLTYKNFSDRDTLWHAAAALGSEAVLDALLRHGREGLSPEALAAAMGAQNNRGQTPLMQSALQGKTNIVKWFLLQGADPWALDRGCYRTALHYAAMRGSIGVMQALLDSMPTAAMCRYIEARSVSGLTPLHYAAAENQAEAVRFLLERGADILAVNSIGDVYDLIYDLVYVARRSSALHVAASQGSLEAAMALLRYWHDNLASPSFPDPRRRLDMEGKTPAGVALGRRSAVLAELLHPGTDLGSLFGAGGEEGAEPRGVPRLAVLVGGAVRQQLLADVDKAEKVIAEYRNRNPETSSFTSVTKRRSIADRPPGDGWAALPLGDRVPGPCCPPPKPFGVALISGSDLLGSVSSAELKPPTEDGAPQHASTASNAASGACLGPAALHQQQPPQPACCAVRQRPNRFVCRSAGFLESEFAAGPVAPVVQCVVCLEDAHCLLSEPCHHRLCATCARHVTQRAPAMPLTCPVCRATVHQFTSPVC